jgi:uncharacterized lipoprotein YajG
MKVSMRKSPRTSRLRHLAALCAAAMLAGCAQGNSSADLAPAAPQPAAQAAAPSAPPPKAALTPEEAKAQCWMKYEGDKKVKNIDQRLTLVEKCVDDTMRGQLVQAPAR